MKNLYTKQTLTYLSVFILTLSGIFFLTDVATDLRESLTNNSPKSTMDMPHLIVESLATFGMVLASFLLWKFLQDYQKNVREVENELSKTKQHIQLTISQKLSEIQLTPTEREIAIFLCKGLETKAIAELRGTSVGTVKAQSHSIYQKARVSSRSELLLTLLEDYLQ